jgi:hypothetical protein
MTRRITLALALAVLAGCNPKVESTGTPTPSPGPTSTALSLRISGHGTALQPVRFVQQTEQGNRVQYDLLARSFESIGAQGSARVRFNVTHIAFHGKDGSTLIADAPQAILDQVANTIEMLGGVHAHNSAGMVLTCDALLYDHTSEMIHGLGHVVIASPNGFRATGDRFDSDISLTHTRMQ